MTTPSDDYTAAIELNPNYAEAYNNRGSGLQLKKAIYNRAIVDYTTAIQLSTQLCWTL